MKAPATLALSVLLAVSLAGCKVTQQSTRSPDGETASEINVDFNDEIKQDVSNALTSTRQEFNDTMTKIESELDEFGEKAKNTELQLKLKQFKEEKDLITIRYQRMDKDSSDPEKSSRVQEEWTEVKNDMKDLWEAIKKEADADRDSANQAS